MSTVSLPLPVHAWRCPHATEGFADDKLSFQPTAQMVWDTTTTFGMGNATAANGNIYVVARFFPKGNV